MIEYKDTGILHRPETFDGWIVNETRGYYPLDLTPSDIVLDIGGHIGSFAARAKKECPTCAVISIEAEQSNYAVLTHNAEKFGFEHIHAAVVSEDKHNSSITLYVNEAKNNATHSTTPIKGRSQQVIQGISFGHLLSELNPTVVKCDIEGGEYDLDWDLLSRHASVKTVIMELHLQKKGSRDQAKALIEKMSSLGFNAVGRIPVVGEKNWTTLAKWVRA